MKKIIVPVLLVLLVCLSLLPNTAYAYNGSDYTSSTSMAAKIGDVLNGNVYLFTSPRKTYHVNEYMGHGIHYWAQNSGYECFAYANAVYYYLTGDVPYRGESAYSNSSVVIRNELSASYELFYNAGVACGAYLRTTNNPNGYYSSTGGHSIIILSYDRNNITWLDANWNDSGTIQLHTRTWADFNTYGINWGGGRIAHVIQPNETNLKMQHKHSFSAPSYVCSCGEWERVYYTTLQGDMRLYKVSASGGTTIRNGPYSACTQRTRWLPKGTEMEAQGYLRNKKGETWYWLAGGYNDYYVKADDIVKRPAPSTLSIGGLAVQYAAMDEGGGNKLTGTITSNYSITVNAYLDGRLYASPSNLRSPVSIQNTAINSRLDFQGLDVGTHTITIVASDAGGGWTDKSVSVTVNAAVSRPAASVTSVAGGKNVALRCGTSGADIYYTTDGSIPKTSGRKYAAPFFLNQTATVRAIAVKSGKQSSELTHYVSVPPAAAPAIGMEYTAQGTRVTVTGDSLSQIYYSDGGGYLPYTGPLMLAGPATVFAYAERPGCTRSETASLEVTVAAPDAPTFSYPVSGTKVAQNRPITLQWNKIYNASSYQLEVCRDGQLVETISVPETNAVYLAADAAVYSFRVTAVNAIGISEPSADMVVTAVEPLNVNFVDWDGTVISSQRVDYGGAAEKPDTDPERTGYYFLYWDGSYQDVTEDRTICAVYRIKTFTVTFYDQNGVRMGSPQTVEYDGSAFAPDTGALGLPAGYAFLGWNIQAESASSQCDFTHVDSNMSVRAVVGWADQELPVYAEITQAYRDDGNSGGNYHVDVTLTNYPDAFTTALLRVSLKTFEGKMVKTESRTIGLTAGEAGSYSFTLNYSDAAAQAEAVVLGYNGDYLTGSAYSQAVQKDITVISNAYGDWSEWSEVMPSPGDGLHQREIETATQYRYKTKTTRTSSYELPGWTLENKVWGSWSGWQDSAVSGSSSRQVETQSVVASYNMETYVCGNSSGTRCYLAYMQSGYSQRAHYTATFEPWQLTQYGSCAQGSWYDYASNVAGYIVGPGTGYPDGNHVPHFIVGTNYKTQYRYRNATYYYYKISDFSDWQDEPVSAGGTIYQVETRTLYRYRDLQDDALAGVGDTSGEMYYFSGALPVDGGIDLNGKLATVMVYKGKNSDPNESQLQYVGQTTIGAGNSYSIAFKTKDAPSVSSGDYVVCLGVQGATGLVNVAMIPAPKETYSVNFYGKDGDMLGSTQYIEEGGSAILPDAPEIFGYRFVSWSETGRNVRSDLDISAIYVPESYAVVFVDWINGSAIPYALPYGSGLQEIAGGLTPSAEGYRFLGWDQIAAGNTAVTGNMIISAVYEAEQYTVRFYDGRGDNKVLVAEETVAYGADAPLPAEPVYSDRIFLGWSAESPWWDVTGDVDVYALSAYEASASEPVSNLGNFVCGVSDTLVLTADEGAAIYYTKDGTDPIPGENGEAYTGGISLTESTEIRAIAVENGKNDSEVITVEFVYDEGGGEYYGDIVTIGSYAPIVDPGDEVTVTVRISQNPGILASMFFIDCDPSVYCVDYVENEGYAYEVGAVAKDGTCIVAPSENGWQVLWFSAEPAEGDGSLFSLSLKVRSDADPGTYPIMISYSANNMLDSSFDMADIECEGTVSGARLRGDIDGDGDLTLADVVKILRHIVGLDVITDADSLAAADVNRDGSVTTADVVRLARYIADLEKSLY